MVCSSSRGSTTSNQHHMTGPELTIPPFLGNARPALRSFWTDKRIASLGFLRSHCPKSVIALDVEGVQGQSGGITSVGVAILQELSGQPSQATGTPADLAAIIKRYGVAGHTIACRKNSRNRRKYEQSPFAKVHRVVDENNIEEQLAEILRDVRRDSILVVWGKHAEFRAMASALPSLVDHLSCWLDVSELVADMTGTQKRPFSLRDVMLSLEFGRGDVQKPSGKHSAGMDAVRTLGVLLVIYSSVPGEISRLILRRHSEEDRSVRKQWEKRPPPEHFPFGVLLSSSEGLPPSLCCTGRFLNYVRKHSRGVEVVAVGLCGKKKPRYFHHAWVCLADEASMYRFVENWVGRHTEVDGKVLRASLPSYTSQFSDLSPNNRSTSHNQSYL